MGKLIGWALLGALLGALTALVHGGPVPAVPLLTQALGSGWSYAALAFGAGRSARRLVWGAWCGAGMLMADVAAQQQVLRWTGVESGAAGLPADPITLLVTAALLGAGLGTVGTLSRRRTWLGLGAAAALPLLVAVFVALQWKQDPDTTGQVQVLRYVVLGVCAAALLVLGVVALLRARRQPADAVGEVDPMIPIAEMSLFEQMDDMVAGARIVVDRPQGTDHPRFPGWTYPVDYGYIDGVGEADDEGIDIFVGTGPRHVTGLLVTHRPDRTDASVALLVGCGPEEVAAVEEFLAPAPEAVLVVGRPSP